MSSLLSREYDREREIEDSIFFHDHLFQFMTTHEDDDDDSATLQRARAGAAGKPSQSQPPGCELTLTRRAAAAAACLRARKWTTTSEGASEQAKEGKDSVGESRERREVAGDSPRNSAALSSATHCNSTRMHAHCTLCTYVHNSRTCVPKKRFKGK